MLPCLPIMKRPLAVPSGSSSWRSVDALSQTMGVFDYDKPRHRAEFMRLIDECRSEVACNLVFFYPPRPIHQKAAVYIMVACYSTGSVVRPSQALLWDWLIILGDTSQTTRHTPCSPLGQNRLRKMALKSAAQGILFAKSRVEKKELYSLARTLFGVVTSTAVAEIADVGSAFAIQIRWQPFLLDR